MARCLARNVFPTLVWSRTLSAAATGPLASLSNRPGPVAASGVRQSHEPAGSAGRPSVPVPVPQSGGDLLRAQFDVQSVPLLQQLSDEQRRVVHHADGPLLVLAGPGTGKTHMIAARVVQLLASGVPGSAIAVLTFSERSSSNMLERIDTQVPMGYSDCVIRTFNAFASDLLKQFASEIRLSPDFVTLSRAEEAVFLLHRLDALPLRQYAPLNGKPTALIRQMLDLFSRLRSANVTAEAYLSWAQSGTPSWGVIGWGDWLVMVVVVAVVIGFLCQFVLVFCQWFFRRERRCRVFQSDGAISVELARVCLDPWLVAGIRGEGRW